MEFAVMRPSMLFGVIELSYAENSWLINSYQPVTCMRYLHTYSPRCKHSECRCDATRMLRVTWLTFRSDTECVNIVTCDHIGRDHREELGGIYPRWRTSCIYTSVALQDYRSTRCILRPGNERKKSG